MKAWMFVILLFTAFVAVACYVALSTPVVPAAIFWAGSLGCVTSFFRWQRQAMKPVQDCDVIPQERQPQQVTVLRRVAVLVSMGLVATAIVMLNWLQPDRVPALRPYSPLRWALACLPVCIYVWAILEMWFRYRSYANPFRKAAALVRDGREVEAIELYRTRLDDPYSGAAAATYLATVLLLRREYREALEVIDKYVTGDRELARLIRYSWQHRLGREVGRWDLSEAALNSMREEFPNQAITRFCDIRWLREREKQFEEADRRAVQALDDFDAKLLEHNGGRESFEQWLNADTYEADELGWRELFGQSVATRKKYGW